jgi:hypothetical protein
MEQGAIQLLVVLLSQEEEGCQRWAAAALAALVRGNLAYVAIVAAVIAVGGVPPLVALLGGRTAPVQQQAMGALSALAEGEGALPPEAGGAARAQGESESESEGEGEGEGEYLSGRGCSASEIFATVMQVALQAHPTWVVCMADFRNAFNECVSYLRRCALPVIGVGAIGRL